MTVRINKDAINLREKLSQLDKPSGLVGEELLRADTSADAREALNLEEHLFEDFESTGIDDNATSTKVTVSDSGVDVDGNLSFGDNGKATFGASDDLEIYHDGSKSIIHEKGQGDLEITANNLYMRNDTGEYYLGAVSNAGVFIRYDNSTKLATTSTGVDVTGTVTADGLVVSGSSTGTLNVANFLNTNSSANATANRLGLGISNSAGANYTYIEAKEVGADNFAEMNFYTGVAPTKRMTVGTNGDVSFYEDTGTTAKFVWDASAESLGIGTGSPSAKMHVISTNEDHIRFGYSDASYATIKRRNSDGRIGIGTQNNDHLVINTSGNVGIGTASPSEKLDVRGAVNGTHAIFTGQAGRGLVIGTENTLSNDDGVSYDAQTSSGKHLFKTNATERARIDSSGNLLVGTTTVGIASTTSQGLNVLGQYGAFEASRNNASLFLNRLSTDGNIAIFRKNGTAVGSIGVNYGQLYIGTGDTGLNFDSTDETILPHNTTTNTQRDSAVNLGRSGARFKDLYLSGGVYLGGTGAANKLDDYEEGTFTPTLTPSTSGTITVDVNLNTLNYTKVGRVVHVTGAVQASSVSSPTGSSVTFGLPFAAAGVELSYRAMGTLYNDYDDTINAVRTQSLGATATIEMDASTVGSGSGRALHISLTYTTNA